MRLSDTVDSIRKVTKNAATDWFASDIGSINNPANFANPVKHTLRIMVSGPTVVNLITKVAAVDDVGALNRGDPLVADAWYVFDFPLITGETYNLQHVTGAGLTVSAVIIESVDMIVGG